MSAALLALINARKAQVSRVKTIKPNAGRNRYRLLPGWRIAAKAPGYLSGVPGADGTPSEKDQWAEQFYMDFGQHFLKDAAGKVAAVALCPEKTFGKPCQICDELNRGIHNSTDDIQLGRLKEALAGASILMNVLALDSPTPNEVQIIAFAPSIFNGKKGVGGIISLFQDWPKLVSLGGPADGCADIIVEKAGVGKEGTTYSVAAVPTTVTVTAAHMAAIKDLDAFVQGEANPQSTQRAISSVSAISGLLPAPASMALLGAAASAFAPAVAQVPLSDIPDFPTHAPVQPVAVIVSTVPVAHAAPATAPAPAVAVVAPVAAPVVVAEQSLEDLLRDL